MSFFFSCHSGGMNNVSFQHQYFNIYVQLSVTPGVSRNNINSTKSLRYLCECAMFLCPRDLSMKNGKPERNHNFLITKRDIVALVTLAPNEVLQLTLQTIHSIFISFPIQFSTSVCLYVYSFKDSKVQGTKDKQKLQKKNI